MKYITFNDIKKIRPTKQLLAPDTFKDVFNGFYDFENELNYEGLGKQLVVAYIGQFGNCRINTNCCLVSEDEAYNHMM